MCASIHVGGIGSVSLVVDVAMWPKMGTSFQLAAISVTEARCHHPSGFGWEPCTGLRTFNSHALRSTLSLLRVKKLYQVPHRTSTPNPAKRRQFCSQINKQTHKKQWTELPLVPKMVKCEHFTGHSHCCRPGEHRVR